MFTYSCFDTLQCFSNKKYYFRQKTGLVLMNIVFDFTVVKSLILKTRD